MIRHSMIRKILSVLLVLVLAAGTFAAAAMAAEENTEPAPAASEPVYTEPEPEPEPAAPETPEDNSSDPAETPDQPQETPDSSDTQEPGSNTDTDTDAGTESNADADTSSDTAAEPVPETAGPDVTQPEEDDDDSTAIYSGNPDIYYDFSDVSGYDYTDIPALAEALDSIFEGHVNIYANAAHTEEVVAELGSFVVPNNDVLQYVGAYGDGSRSMIGTSCWIYGNGFYYTLFHDYVGNGSSFNSAYSENLYISDVSYQGFLNAGVRQQPGAYMRLGGRHTVCLLNYDENYITIIDGNGDGVGGVAIRCYTWSDFAQRVASFGGVSHTVQAQDWYFRSLYPTTVASGTCGDQAEWYLDENGLLTIMGYGEIDPAGFAEYADSVISISVQSGITGIPRAAFKDFANLAQIDLADTVAAIGYNAFDGTQIDEDVLEAVFENVETIGSREEEYSHDLVGISVSDGNAPEYEPVFVAERCSIIRPVVVNEDMLEEPALFTRNVRAAVQLVPIELNEALLLPAEYAWSAQ